MADLTVVNPALTAATGVEPVPATATASDRFMTTRGRKYLLRINNAHSSGQTTVVDDPTSGGGVVGASTAQVPDVAILVPNGTAPDNQQVVLLDADRFADANGWINLSVSPAPTTLTYEVYGPF